MTPGIACKPPAVLVCLVCLLLLPALLPAQTAREMDRLLDTPELSCGQAARFVLEAAEALPRDFSPEQDPAEPFRMARTWGWLPRQARMDDPITLRELSLLLMEAFRMRGGLMYTLLHTGRYAHRELVYRRIIQGRGDPLQTLSGERFLHILGRTMSYTGAGEDPVAGEEEDDITPGGLLW